VPVQRGLVENVHVVEALATNRADDALHVAHCHGERGADRTSLIPMASTSLRDLMAAEAAAAFTWKRMAALSRWRSWISNSR
jgi:hypothetical protein